MDKDKKIRKAGRKPLNDDERKENFTFRISKKDIDFLQNEANNLGTDLSRLIREKLMEREAISLSKNLPKPIEKSFTDLLKLAGSLLLLSQKVERDKLYSDQVRGIMNDIFQIVNSSKKSVQEATFNFSHYKKLKGVLELLRKIDIHKSTELWENEFIEAVNEFNKILSKVTI